MVISTVQERRHKSNIEDNSGAERLSTDSIELQLNMDEENKEMEIPRRRSGGTRARGKKDNAQPQPERTGGSHFRECDILGLEKARIIVSELRIQSKDNI